MVCPHDTARAVLLRSLGDAVVGLMHIDIAAGVGERKPFLVEPQLDALQHADRKSPYSRVATQHLTVNTTLKSDSSVDGHGGGWGL